MSYKRFKSRNSKRNRNKREFNDYKTDCCPIPDSELKTFVEQNPNASESALIQAFFGQPMIPQFNEYQPNLINTCPEKMADYKLQRQLIQRAKTVKKENTDKYPYESSGVRFSFSSEPFFTVLIKIMSNRKITKNEIHNNLEHLGTIEDIVLFTDGCDFQSAFVRFQSSDVAFDLSQKWDQIKFNYGLIKNVSIKAFPKRHLCSNGGYELWAFMRPIDRHLLIEKVRNSLESGQHFYKMVEYLLLTETDRQNRLILCQNLESIINNHRQRVNDIRINCKFHVFGSTVNELGFCDSDIDVFIEIIEENNFSVKMDSKTAITYLFHIREVLGRELRMYIRPTIQSRRCPLVKLDFRQFGDSLRENGISLDLSLVDSLGIHNSKLIAFYCKIEPHFKTLAVILRYLAKIKGFIGSSQMSSYAFSMLIIFFCQTLNPQLLPTVDKLMEMKTKSVIINGFECGFYDDADHYRQSVPFEWNNSSVNYFFQQFFQFYSNFDFKTRVICPRNGIPVSKSIFDRYLGSLGITNVREFKMTDFICIQDPFDLTFNMTHHMPYKLFLELRSWFRKVSANSHQYFSEDYNSDPNLLTFVDLLEHPIQPSNVLIEEIKKQIEKDAEEEDDIEIIENVISRHSIARVTTKFEPNIADEYIDTQMEDWASKVGQFFRLLFREGFKMKCFYDTKPKSKIKLNQKTTFETFVIQFKTTDRRIIDKNLRELERIRINDSLPNDFIKGESIITKAILENSEHCLIIDDNSDVIQLNIELSFEKNKEIYLNVTNKPRNDLQLPKILIDFICQTFFTGLKAEKLLTIDDDIVFL